MDFPPALLHALRVAQEVVVLTGAGISAESGVPTFRDAQTGLWAQYDPLELATPQAFRQNPRLVWEWYSWRRELVKNAKPNPGHYALVSMEQKFPRFSLITQNVDGLHQLAGSQQVITLHGNIKNTKCFSEGTPVESWEDNGEIPPRCPRCGGLLRPDVVWFNESLSPQLLFAAHQAAKNSDVFFSIGTSSLVEPAASIPYIALDKYVILVEINITETPLTKQAAYAFHEPAGDFLPALVTAIWG